MNFYIIVGEINNNNRKEVHLAGFKPSSKVQTETNNYKDANNMVWGIMIPTVNFKYPTESTRISNAYPMFNNWAKSSGNSNPEWYLYPVNNNTLVYTR